VEAHFASLCKYSDFEEEITNTGRELGFDEVENDCVWELLSSHSEELTDDDVLLLDQQRAVEEADNDADEGDDVQVKEFIIKESEESI
jgi:hypothetical protein